MLLLTNRHVVTGRDNNSGKLLSTTGAFPKELRIALHRWSQPGKWVDHVEPLYDDHEIPRWVEHPVLGEQADFVGLPLRTFEGGGTCYPIDVAPQRHFPGPFFVNPAEVVSVIGFPFGQSVGGGFPIWATGFVASDIALDYNELPCWLLDCRTRSGQSGSPVSAVRPAGNVIYEGGGMNMGGDHSQFMGIYSGRINDKSDIGIVWRADAIAELVASIRWVPPSD
jgi:hypothetical protein